VNGSKIQVYSSLTFQLVNTLHRHSAGVHSLIWEESDTTIVSVGNDGAMYIHRADSSGQDNSYTTAQVQYFAVAALPSLSSIFVAGSDMKVKEVQSGQVVREVPFRVAHTQLAVSHNGQLLFSGTRDGRVFCHGLPIGDDRTVVNCHIGAVTGMALSFDDGLLFTTGEDGTLCIFNIRDKDNRVRNPERAFFSDELQTTRAELDEKANQLRTAQAERTEHEMSFRMRTEMIESTHKSKEMRLRENAKKSKDRNRILNENRKKENRRDRDEQYRKGKAGHAELGGPDCRAGGGVWEEDDSGTPRLRRAAAGNRRS
jgi:WD40 repeat protein